MKIFYAVQATGNGHISRAMELLPALQEYGTVDIFLSGNNSHLPLDAPVKYRSQGISLYYNCEGGLHYWQMFRKFRPFQLRREIRELPVEKYDLVINDFDYITSAACATKGISSIHFGHQASFQSPLVPRPGTKNKIGEWLLKKYVKADHHLGLHFKSYDNTILPAIVKKEILEATPTDYNYITVYLPSYCEAQLAHLFHALPQYRFQVFSKETNHPKKVNNIEFLPVNKQLFNQSLSGCTGIITGGGFETPAEALHLGKRMIIIPIKGQYEQQCNAAALQQMGIPCLEKAGEELIQLVPHWVETPAPSRIDYSGSIPKCIETLMTIAGSLSKQKAARTAA
jgi:uncharacterized protein (TIGR00661 family)